MHIILTNFCTGIYLTRFFIHCPITILICLFFYLFHYFNRDLILIFKQPFLSKNHIFKEPYFQAIFSKNQRTVFLHTVYLIDEYLHVDIEEENIL